MDDSEREGSILRNALGRAPACPPTEILAVAGTSSEVRRHLDSCARCRAEIALLHQFESGEPSAEEAESLRWIEAELAQRDVIPQVPAEKAPVARPTRRFGGWRVLGWAASLAVVIAAFVYQRPLDEIRPRGSGQPVWRSMRFSAISPAGDLTTAPSVLSWEAVPGAASYRVRLMEMDGTVIWSVSVSATSVEIPRKIQSVIVPGRTFTWDVSAWSKIVEKIGASDLQTVHILSSRQ